MSHRLRVSHDAAHHVVTVKLEAGAPGSSGPFNFALYTDGGATLVASPGSTA